MTRHQTAAPRKDPKTRTWSFVIDVPGPDGTRRQTRRRGFRTKKDAQAELDRLRTDVRQGVYIPPSRQTLAQYVNDDWLPTLKMSVGPSTWASYRRNLHIHVLPRIGGLQLTEVGPEVLDRLYAELRQSGNRGAHRGASLSVRTVRYIHTIVGKALRDAVRKGQLLRNPADTANPPRARDAKIAAQQTMRTWTAAQLEEFLHQAEGNRYQPAWLFLATTGCRRGEGVGLTWTAIDLDNRRCSIRQTITAIDHQLHTAGGTKTDTGRNIGLDVRTVTALRTWKARQAEERLLLGAGYQDHDLGFCHPDGRPYHPERFSREFDRMVTRQGAPRIRLHDLRHTWATLALQAGVPLKVVSERLGHATTSVTADVYSHVTPGMQTDAAERVADLIFGPAPTVTNL
jgi:integrase